MTLDRQKEASEEQLNRSHRGRRPLIPRKQGLALQTNISSEGSQVAVIPPLWNGDGVTHHLNSVTGSNYSGFVRFEVAEIARKKATSHFIPEPNSTIF